MLKAKEKIVWRKKKELLVVLDTDSGKYFTLNETAQDLWMSHIVNGETLAKAAEELGSKFADTPPLENVIADCQKLIDEWVENGLVEEQEG